MNTAEQTLIHKQSPIQFMYGEDGLFRGVKPRREHWAIAVFCPRCQAGAGSNCRQNGMHLSPLSVHIERARAAL